MIVINKKRFNENIYAMMLLSIFLTPYYFRKNILGDLGAPNIVFIGLMIVYMFINLKKINMRRVILIILIIIYIFIIDKIGSNNNMESIFKSISINIFPIFVLTIRMPKNEFKGSFYKFLKVFNIFTFIIFFIGLLDPLLDFKIMKNISYSLEPSLIEWINVNSKLIGYRYTSYMGHALFTKEIFIYFYFLNIIFEKTFGKRILNENITKIIAVIGILLTGSKFGTILIIISIFITDLISNKLKSLIISIIILVVGYILGFFKTIFIRLNNTSFTSGRYESLVYINRFNIIKTRLFTGYGEYIDRIILLVSTPEVATASLEFPIVILILKYGVLCTLMIGYIIFLYPLITFFRRRQLYLIFIFFIKLIDVNSYNGLILKPDNMILFVLFVSILLGVSDYKNYVCEVVK